MEIKKILIYNFKNFRHETVIDFSDSITFLVGPNGFGKTTIFDAIELGLTGKLSRINKVTGENIIYNKPFFQNEIGSPVVIKLWLEKKRGDQLVIVRKLENDSTDGKKVYAPIKSTSQFKLFRQDEVDDTNFIEIDNIRLSDFTQSSIDEFLGVEGKYEIEKIFNLFNYIQQEETTFFLKQTEQDRSDSLSFLVKTDDIEEKIEKIDKITRAINNKLNNLQAIQRTLTQSELEDVRYERLFNQEFAFDRQEPFSSGNLDQLKTFQSTIQNIINFKKRFSVREYRRRIEREHKIQEINNNRDIEQALYYSILYPIINRPGSKWLWEKYTLDNPILFEYTRLENYLQSFDVITRENKRRKELDQYLTNLSKDINQMIVQSFDYVQGDSLANDFESLKQQFGQYQNLRGQANQIDKNLSDLKQFRINLANQFNELRQHHHIVEDNKCPFCNSQFQSFKDLEKSYVDYENYLTSISSQSSQNLQVIQSSMNSLIQDVKQKIYDEINSLTTNVDDSLLVKLQELNGKYETYSKNINGFKTFIQSYIYISPYQLGSLGFEIYGQQYQINLREFRSKLGVDDDIYSLVDVNNLKSIRANFEELRREYPELQLETYQLNQMQNQKISKSMLDNRLSEMKQSIHFLINARYAINENLLMDTENIFPIYFQNNVELLENISIEVLERKKLYLNKQHNLVQNQRFQDLSRQISILGKTAERLKELNIVYNEEVKRFKISIVKQLRIPFFIYSAKMLQNYQQGLGIFLTYKKTNEDKDEPKAAKKMIIRFKSDSSNDHDAMNQLSTGQLAVVSLAFTLSLNTMFKLSDNLNFLMIDDPIQDMDAMNVLSFIEILRHGIIERYQIILSTYSDQNALFMGYKFANSNSQVDIKYKNVRELQG
ncbi:Chromosome partition protein Smc [Streptococcus infantarius subsp. infantarius]|nr:Chromosome partition protein Smc [Streptococcus infantarius subsp. infantarius]